MCQYYSWRLRESVELMVGLSEENEDELFDPASLIVKLTIMQRLCMCNVTFGYFPRAEALIPGNSSSFDDAGVCVTQCMMWWLALIWSRDEEIKGNVTVAIGFS